jgi:RNA polymerase sigma-70 factor, ECF subfamily
VQSLARRRLPTRNLADDEDRSPSHVGTERELVARATHDPQAFALLYRRYLDPIYRYCYHRLGSKEAAEDVTSQVFARALSALSTYRGERPFRSWLFAVAHNAIVDAHRAQRPHQPLAAAQDVLDPTASPEDLVLVAEGERTVQALLAALTPDQARVIELRLVGLTESEIAGVLGRRPGAVRALQFRALIRLRSLLRSGDSHQEVVDAEA